MRRVELFTGNAKLEPRHLRAWFFAACAACIWFEVLLRAAHAAPPASLSPLAAAAVGLATQLAFTSLEASLGVATWAVLGRRVRWGDLAPALLTVSVTEAFAVALLSEPALLPEAVRVLLAGSRASSAPTEPGALAQAFAGLGLLTLLRLALATHVHVDALRASAAGASPRRWQHAALLVLAFYSASRLAIWWGLDLIRGRSFES